MQVTSPLAGAAVRRAATTAAAAGSGPRTHLPFLLNVVKTALKSANTSAAAPALSPSSSSSPATALPPIPACAFKPYPLLGRGAAKQSAGSSLLFKDDACIVVNDAFPKSAMHCLVMPVDLRLQSLNALERRDIPLLRHMMHVGDEYVRYLQTTSPQVYQARRFIAGFHAIPSLPMLHLHVLSMDLDSPCIKNKKHYNSFATFFFLTSARILEDLERHGRVTLNQDVVRLRQMEEQDMRCLWCGTALANIPTMKAHIQSCPLNNAMEKPAKEDSRQGSP
ncbi:Scavenger mRNA decapping enzyme C-term binding/HIT domain containing protein [Novymonas esmeraldas]|uniref:Scavenger mRNA decapping enzyme C-term binding/HIT domain containing protein n=1 Tax=Novymonas esmeraldas TaxID=1808958 RepID=A0AAW0EQU1_9TRYP